jgi:hypothetical protein
MSRISIVGLQAVASDENFASSVRDLSAGDLKMTRGGTYGHEGKEKEKEEEKKKYCPCHPCHP